ncbi:uncharacterized protein UTRI_04543_B [Ustilago trichophora]|uniref:Uncharacterized protein n=1 Tax=Ustilago trichophora TaxID=86804 RepID=A0A5C3EEQ8_9BASI|nr:uncharacterized protein UTRI_04543_B [Ustilago trichophora]
MKSFFIRVAMLLALISLICAAPVPLGGKSDAVNPGTHTGIPAVPETSTANFHPEEADRAGDTMMQGGQTFAEGELPMGSPGRILAADDHSSVTSEVSPRIEDATGKSAQIHPPVKAEPVSSDRSAFRKFHQKAALTLQKAKSKFHRLLDRWQPAFSNLEMERLLQKLPEEPLEFETVTKITQNMPEFNGKQILTLGRNPKFDRSAILTMIQRGQPFFVKGGKGKFWSFDRSSEAPDAHFVWTDKIPKDELSQLKQAADGSEEAAEGAEEAAGIAREGLESPETATQAARSLEEATIGYTTAFPRPGAQAGGLSAHLSDVPPSAADHPTMPLEEHHVMRPSETLTGGIRQHPVRIGTLQDDTQDESKTKSFSRKGRKHLMPTSPNYEMVKLIQERPTVIDPKAYTVTKDLPRVNGKEILTLSGDPSLDKSAMAVMTNKGEAFYVEGGNGKFWSLLRSTVPGESTLVLTDQLEEEELALLKKVTAATPTEAAGIAREGLGSPETATQAARSLEESTIGHTTAFPRSGVDAGGLSARLSKVPSATAGHRTVPSEGLTGMTADASTRAASEAAPEGVLDSGRVSELTDFWEREADRQMSRSSSSKSVEQATRSAPREAAEFAREGTTAEHAGIISEAESVDSQSPRMLDSRGPIIPKLESKNLVPYRGPWYKPWSWGRQLSPATQRMARFLDSRPPEPSPGVVYDVPSTDKGQILKISKGNRYDAQRVTYLTQEGDAFHVLDQDNNVFRFKPKKDEANAFTWTDDVTKTQKAAVKKAFKDYNNRKQKDTMEAMEAAQRIAQPAESSRPWLQKATENAGNFLKDLPKYLRGR